VAEHDGIREADADWDDTLLEEVYDGHTEHVAYPDGDDDHDRDHASYYDYYRDAHRVDYDSMTDDCFAPLR
jgi:hypothetical protein